MPDAIIVENVSKTYKSADETIKALDNVSISVKTGEIFGLLGPNGAGKTSLISVLCGILIPDGGKVQILDMDCLKEIKKIQKVINVVSGFTGTLFALSLEEALMYYCLLYNVQNPKEKIDWAIKLANLEDSRKTEADELSAGLRQRFLIAKALLNDPKVLILDEPTVGLDVESAINIRNIIRNLRTSGRTILLTTHNMFEADELCDRIAFINKGKIVNIGTPGQLKDQIIRISEKIIEINCSDSAEVLKLLSKIKGASASLKDKGIVLVSVDNYNRMNDILKALSSLKAEVYNITALEPTLEETYLKLINNIDNNKGNKTNKTIKLIKTSKTNAYGKSENKGENDG
ncbi:ABC transporter ATP-binding protein [Candidatus Micrarchaeota archaeon]|nr:ABC transporter ATP-binding protein [Candidatus Micrarchaeota archaeon]